MKKAIVFILVMLFVLASCCGIGETTHGSEKVTESGSAFESASLIPDEGYSFGTVGLYVWNNNPSQYSFWKKIGIDTLQFCDRGWWYNSENGSLD
ncbi:MAG: hypothetical protein IKS28_00955, partial [Clostridia bacterium]|nr:hypothetical protein [Clostridia bacterium]